MKKFMIILVNASLCVYLLVGGIVPVHAGQPASQPRQVGDWVYINYVPLVIRDYSLIKATSISAGAYHTCALTETGGVKCWGQNFDGQLGDGTTVDKFSPVDVVGLGGGVKAISAGNYHTCALTTAGGVKCWGRNTDGQLGNGTKISSSIPVDVISLTIDVRDVRAGGFHTCAIKMNDVIRCWGNNDFGQLGDNTKISTSVSVKVSVIPETVLVRTFRLGQFHTCIVTTTGVVQCWGSNGFGQLGNGTKIDSLTPVIVSGVSSGVSVLATGASHNCAVTADTGLSCWGSNEYGQLGNGTETTSSSPVKVSGMTGGVSGVSAGLRHTCAIRNDVMKCWGFNFYGQLGDGSTDSSNTPVNVSGLTGKIDSIRVGYMHTCALMDGGGVRCWGDNQYGQLGDGSSIEKHVPASVIGFP